MESPYRMSRRKTRTGATVEDREGFKETVEDKEGLLDTVEDKEGLQEKEIARGQDVK